MSLLERHVRFVHALREAGIPVSPAEGLDAARALRVIELTERETLREAYAATLVKRAVHRPGFDTLFDLWFPPVTGPARRDAGDGPDLERAEVSELRERLAELLRDGAGASGDPAFGEFVRAAVERFGRQPAAPGRQAWFSYPVLRALSPGTLMAGMLREALAGEERGGLAEKVARRRLADAVSGFEDAVAADVRRRIAEESGIDRIARSAVRPPVDRIDFLRAAKTDLEALRREVHPLARRLATRLTVKQRLGHRGRLDFRRTVRASLGTGGVPLVTHMRPRRPHKPELVILCDASDSVSTFSHFTLLLTYALREQFTKVRAFAFVDTVDEITRFFAPGADVLDAITRMTAEADISRFGRSDYGQAFERFAARYGDAVGPKTSLLILGDARCNYQPPRLDTVRRLTREARHTYWLNPEPRAQWDTGDSLATAYGGVVEMRECRNVTQLAAFVEDLR
ncbi:VWA domain-containing protein [Sphaerisporangium sp. TRM90804]|uniref:vWA domain-containing protein n=1 Tax=Sphaerisporangium sp. TRM90804 TaxID=3031113 RepID=UPI00244A7CC1|nr:VWA domain-containing protein [Sphaerisporangium sp. TRM90804]MDH2427438.1 VWA domain-containing protein [Sphaerisporangium sp. TRM90804]